MQSWAFTAVGVGLAAFSALLLAAHWVAAQSLERQSQADSQRRTLRSQLRRRIQTSGLLGLVGLGIGAGQYLSPSNHPLGFIAYWLGVCALTLWVVLLAAGDLLVTRMRLAGLRAQRRAEEARLNRELEQRLQQRGAPSPREE